MEYGNLVSKAISELNQNKVVDLVKLLTEEKCNDYEMYEDLFEGEHYKVFKWEFIGRLKAAGFNIDDEGYVLKPFEDFSQGFYNTRIRVSDMFVTANKLGAASKVFKDMIFGELPTIVPSTGKTIVKWYDIKSIEQEFYDKFSTAALQQSYIGAACLKVIVNNGISELYNVDMENVKINMCKMNKYCIDNIEITYEEKIDEENTMIYKEIHRKYNIEFVTYLNKELHDYRVEPTFENNWMCFIIYNSPEKEIESDYNKSAIELQREYNIRLTQMSMSMDKTQNPTMFGPGNLTAVDPITGKRYADMIGKYIPVMMGENPPGYMTYSGAYSEAMNYLKNIIENDLFVSLDINPAVFDAKSGNGTLTGSAIKKSLIRTLAKINSKKNQWSYALVTILKLMFKIDTGFNSDFKITFFDPIPTDEEEQARIAQIRTGGLPTQSIMASIQKMDNKDEASAKLEIEQIISEKERIDRTKDVKKTESKDNIEKAEDFVDSGMPKDGNSV